MANLAAYPEAMPARRTLLLRWTLFLGGLLTGAELDLFSPGLPQIQQQFELSAFVVEWCVSGNLLAFCVTSWLFGRAADSYGRRRAVLWGLGMLVAGSLLCVAAPGFTCLLLGRFLQGAGASSLAVMSHVLLIEACAPAEQARVLGLVNGATTAAMSGAPLLGSFLVRWGGWRLPFAFLSLWGVVVLLMMGSSLAHAPTKTSARRSRPRLVASKELVLCGVALACLTAPYWAFVGLAPLIYITGMNVPLAHFGWYQGILTAVFGAVSMLSGRIVQKTGSKRALDWSCAALAAAAGALVSCAWLGGGPGTLTAAVSLLSAGAVIPYTRLYPQFLRAAGRAKSQAAAVLLCARFTATIALIQVTAQVGAARLTCLACLMAAGILSAIYASRQAMSTTHRGLPERRVNPMHALP